MIKRLVLIAAVIITLPFPYNYIFASEHVLDLSALDLRLENAHRKAIAINEDDTITFKVKERIGTYTFAYIEPRSNTIDEATGLIDYVFLKPLGGPNLKFGSKNGLARQFEAVKSGTEIVEIFYRGGAVFKDEKPSLVVEVTIRPFTGEPAKLKAERLKSEENDITILREVNAYSNNFVVNVHKLRQISGGYDSSPFSRKIARQTLKSMSDKMVTWLKVNPGVYEPDIFLGCAEVQVKDAAFVFRGYLETKEGVNPEILRCSIISLGKIEGKSAIKAIAPYLLHGNSILKSTAFQALAEITRDDYNKEAVRFQDWHEWWNKRGSELYGVGEYKHKWD